MPKKAELGRVQVNPTGKPNTEELVKAGRLKAYDDPFNPVPSAQSGHTMDAKTGMRIGLTPQSYLENIDRDLSYMNMGHKIPASACRLTKDELEIMRKHKFSEDEKARVTKYLKQYHGVDF